MAENNQESVPANVKGEAMEQQQDKHGYMVPNPITKIDHVIGIVSGKGGVGKSLVTSLLATAMQRAGKSVGIMDADITGPSIPRSFGLKGPVKATPLGIGPIATATGVQVMSTNFLLPDESAPVIWRGPVISGMVQQFWTDVAWGHLDYLFIDMPPGTGDVPLTIFQNLPVEGVVIVTSPQDLVSMIVAKAVNMAADMHVPVLGLVENMSYFVCPDCGSTNYIFGKSDVEKTAADNGIELVVKLPIDPSIAAQVDAGKVEDVRVDGVDEFAQSIVDAAAKIPMRDSPSMEHQKEQEQKQEELEAKLDAALGPKKVQ